MNSDATEKTERNRIGERLKLARGTTSQGEYSKLLGVTTNTIGRYERGERTPDVDFISAICKETGVNPRWLILGEEPMYDAEASQERPRLKMKDLMYKNEDELPSDIARSLKKARKAVQAWGQRWDELPEWAKEEFDELYEQVEALTKERDEARAAELKAKDEAIKAQNMALQALADVGQKYPTKVAVDLLNALQKGGGYSDVIEMLKALHKTQKSETDIDDEPETHMIQYGTPQSLGKNHVKK
jgi:transcriptional regulator with XRE-family HTH domain